MDDNYANNSNNTHDNDNEHGGNGNDEGDDALLSRLRTLKPTFLTSLSTKPAKSSLALETAQEDETADDLLARYTALYGPKSRLGLVEVEAEVRDDGTDELDELLLQEGEGEGWMEGLDQEHEKEHERRKREKEKEVLERDVRLLKREVRSAMDDFKLEKALDEQGQSRQSVEKEKDGDEDKEAAEALSNILTQTQDDDEEAGMEGKEATSKPSQPPAATHTETDWAIDFPTVPENIRSNDDLFSAAPSYIQGRGNDTKDEENNEDEPWCAICYAEAMVYCHGCEGIKYCWSCWKEGHTGNSGAGMQRHRWDSWQRRQR